MVHQVAGDRFRPETLPPGRVPVLFVADWCGYCRRFLPFFKRMQDGWVVDVSDESDPLWDAYEIHVVPTVILFEDGAPARRWAGVLGEGHADEIAAAVATPA